MDKEDSTVVEQDHQKAQFNMAALEYMKTAKLILRDMEKEQATTQFFSRYKREDVIRWLKTPSKFGNELIHVCRHLAGISQHFRRLYEYFGKMSMLSYIVLPYKLNETGFDKEKFKKSYKKTIDELEVMNIKNEFPKIIDVMFREDVAYCYEYKTSDSYFIKLLPVDYCEITTVVDGVFGYSFNFSYFDRHPNKLPMYGEEFESKYKLYQVNRTKYKWQEIDDSRSFALKLSDTIDYVIPMFANLIPFLYDIEDIKQLDKSKKELDNYKLLIMKLETDEQGDYKVDFKEYEKFYNMINTVLPKNIGIGMSLTDLQDITFERSGAANEISSYSQSQSDFWSSAGVSELLFNGSKSSSATITNSIKNDSQLVFYVHRMIERVINRKLKQRSGTYKFKINILDVTQYNQKEYLDNLIKTSTYGVPVKMAILAVFGYTPSDTYGMTILEDVLDLTSKWKPLQSSNTQSGEVDSSGGAPEKDDGELSDSGSNTRDNDNRKLE